MSAFFLDIWHDLKRKRLWPVAAVLLIAAIAVPVAVMKPAPEPGAEAPPPTAEPVADAGLVARTTQPEAGSSGLDSFKSKNPFRSGLKPQDADADASGSEETEIDRGTTSDGGTGDLASGAGTPGSGLGSSGATGTTSGSSAAGSSGSQGAPAAGGSTSGGGGGGGVETRYFSYEVDVVYGETGRTRNIDGIEPFTSLTERNPRLLFIGADAKGEVATFSVLDEDLREHGDGRCVRAGGRCSVLFLKSGEEHRFIDRDTDDEYKIRLVAINEVEFDK